MNPEAWRGKRVFITGHTGFKGSWLTLLLLRLRVELTGFSLISNTDPNLFDLIKIESSLSAHHLGDIRDINALTAAMISAEPEIVIHLAAQPLVVQSYKEPLETWATNVMGTANLLEATRSCPSVKVLLVVTTDKCYENQEWAWGYREIDPLGGIDPYSASKASAELVVSSYRRSFFHNSGVLIATARAGNVIGGGDWSKDRLIPDAVRAFTKDEILHIRNPDATRPWQHVLDAISGYVLLVERLLESDRTCAKAFNFGPKNESNQTVEEVINSLNKHWNTLNIFKEKLRLKQEASYLSLDTSLARKELGWAPKWEFEDSIKETANWYKQVINDPKIAREITLQQIEKYFGNIFG